MTTGSEVRVGAVAHTWLILPVVICLSQRVSCNTVHGSLSRPQFGGCSSDIDVCGNAAMTKDAANCGAQLDLQLNAPWDSIYKGETPSRYLLCLCARGKGVLHDSLRFRLRLFICVVLSGDTWGLIGACSIPPPSRNHHPPTNPPTHPAPLPPHTPPKLDTPFGPRTALLDS